jgi:hypothetical protein
MSDELLERATRALSSRYAPEKASAAGDLGLHKLGLGLAAARAHRARWRMVGLVAAASFVGLTAWATASGRLPRWIGGGNIEQRASQTDSDGTHGALSPPRGDLAVSAVPITPDVVPTAADVPPITDRVTRTKESAPRSNAGPRLDRPAVQGSVAEHPSKSPDLAPEADLDVLYRAAHEAHFVRRDSEAALAAWDRYIAAAGADGRMTLEARYNRAITLVRLGRNDEARAALEPFARGEFGGYRRDDALRLLQSLR